MKLRDRLLIALAFACVLGFLIINHVQINSLKQHHVVKYEKYSYAYDCMKEAELKYWEYKSLLVNEVQNYILSVAPTSNLRGYALVEECEHYNVDIVFALVQGEVESHFATKGLGAKINNVYNVGVFDGKSLNEIDNSYVKKTPNESISLYLELLTTNYLVGKTEQDLLVEYVDINNKRYASNPNYEEIISFKYNNVLKTTKIAEYYSAMKHWAIKCNR